MSNCIEDETPTVEPLTIEPKLKGLSPSKKLQIAVRVPPGLFNEFKRYVEETGISQTKVVLNALAQYLGSVEDVSITQRLLELEKRVDALEARRVDTVGTVPKVTRGYRELKNRLPIQDQEL